MTYPNWNLEELEYWKIAAFALLRHFSLRGLSYPASHLQKFLGGCEAEMLEGEVGRELRAVKRGIEWFLHVFYARRPYQMPHLSADFVVFVVGIGEAYLQQVCRQCWNTHGHEWFLHVF